MKNQTSSAFSHITLGIQLAVIMLIFVYGGYKLDVYFDKMPLFVCIGLFVGMAAGFYNLMRELKAMDKSLKESKENKENDESGDKTLNWM
ncbi:MAG: AtpZ/AtpI family protein [Spirochaetia bacterium]|jgi:F0F1-type ATP synthase assembly protein I|nr:AtpZ/AtpI family protein [Spirochaetia bacterium]